MNIGINCAIIVAVVISIVALVTHVVNHNRIVELFQKFNKWEARIFALEDFKREQVLGALQRLNHSVFEDTAVIPIFLSRIVEHGFAVYKLGDRIKIPNRSGVWTFARLTDDEKSPLILTNGSHCWQVPGIFWDENWIAISAFQSQLDATPMIVALAE